MLSSFQNWIRFIRRQPHWKRLNNSAVNITSEKSYIGNLYNKMRDATLIIADLMNN